jgi:hypothetical protein
LGKFTYLNGKNHLFRYANIKDKKRLELWLTKLIDTVKKQYDIYQLPLIKLFWFIDFYRKNNECHDAALRVKVAAASHFGQAEV